MYRYSSTSWAGKAATLPAAIAEFYGCYTEPGGVEEAQAAYLQQVAEFEKEAASLQQVGHSVRMLTAPLPGKPGWKRMLPFLVEQRENGESTAGKESKDQEASASPRAGGGSLAQQLEAGVRRPEAEKEQVMKLLTL
jgi:hypothetical protein